MALVRTPNTNKNVGSVGNSIGDRRVRSQAIQPAPLPAQPKPDKFAGVVNRKPTDLSGFASNATYNHGKRFSNVGGTPYRTFVVDAIEKGYAPKRTMGPVSRPTDTAMLKFLDRIIDEDSRAQTSKGAPAKKA